MIHGRVNDINDHSKLVMIFWRKYECENKDKICPESYGENACR